MTSLIRGLHRRHFLRAAGVSLGLPWLPSLARRARGAAEDGAPPRRLAYLYVPNGVNVARWQVEGQDADYRLSPTLQPLAPFRDDVTVISGLNHENATKGPDGGGDHARSTAVYLTGVRPKKTGGTDIRNGVSVDQFAARRLGHLTRLPSLELSTDGARASGRCDSGYSCAYQYNLSWASPTKPVPAERNPRAVFERMFGAADTSQAGVARRKLQQSILDFVKDDARALERRLGGADRDKLDQYLTAVRDVERRIQRAEQSPADIPDFKTPTGIPESYREHIRTIFDLMVLAFQTDSTRIITFMLAHDGSDRAFPEIGVPEAHHQLSHHRGNPLTLEKIAKIDRFYVEQFAWLLERLRQVREGDQRLLDNCMIVYGSCLSEGNKHWHSNLPVVLAGGGGGTLKPGKLLAAEDPTPMCNLHLALLRRMGVRASRFGDSTGALAGI
jgi:hypothetical protein